VLVLLLRECGRFLPREFWLCYGVVYGVSVPVVNGGFPEDVSDGVNIAVFAGYVVSVVFAVPSVSDDVSFAVAVWA